MSKTTHGPFEIAITPKTDIRGALEIVGPLPDRLIYATVWGSDEAAHELAHLFQSAPDLLDACVMALLVAEDYADESLIEILRPAIAKAKGEPAR